MPDTRRRATKRYSPATLALMAEGPSQRMVAESLGCSQEYVSRQLAGVNPLTPQLPAALVELLGDEAAARILALVPPKPAGATAAPA